MEAEASRPHKRANKALPVIRMDHNNMPTLPGYEEKEDTEGIIRAFVQAHYRR
jgi:hypothetical protein